MTSSDTTRHGCSGKPLFQKLGLKPGMRCMRLNPPAHHPELLQGAPSFDLVDAPGPADFVHLFCHHRCVLEEEIYTDLSYVSDPRMPWAHRKKSSKLFEDLTVDGLHEIILPTGWVDVKVCAIDQARSGLKFLRRKA